MQELRRPWLRRRERRPGAWSGRTTGVRRPVVSEGSGRTLRQPMPRVWNQESGKDVPDTETRRPGLIFRPPGARSAGSGPRCGGPLLTTGGINGSESRRPVKHRPAGPDSVGRSVGRAFVPHCARGRGMPPLLWGWGGVWLLRAGLPGMGCSNPGRAGICVGHKGTSRMAFAGRGVPNSGCALPWRKSC